MDALLKQLPRLGPLLGTAGAGSAGSAPVAAGEGRALFLRLLAQLLVLAPQRTLAPTGAAYKFILRSYIGILGFRCAFDVLND